MLKKGLIIILGSMLLGIGVNWFLVPYRVLDGGVIGVGLIMKYMWGLEAGFVIILISIPIFIIAWFKYRQYFYNSLHGMMISSFFIDVFHFVPSVITVNATYSAIIGGILVGLGIGLMLRYKTSTGGTDLVAQFISDITKLNVGILIFMIDALIIFIGGLLFSTETLLLSALTIIFVGGTTSLCTWKMSTDYAA
ncbi:YitT family protein [Litchfieldia alkalitelluris]|uniref:YitT family protein n=1 Tax=Litchfieldia alkalitelluris TaxID=304268 RepID=UPI000997B8E7|nr:YitT family protein [Litchfieldia alkalitelluris]